MITCKLCWCHTGGYKGLGCKLRTGFLRRSQDKMMPCGVPESRMSIIVGKHLVWTRLRKIMDEIALGEDLDVNNIDVISKEIGDALKIADRKMCDLITAYQNRIEEMKEEEKNAREAEK